MFELVNCKKNVNISEMKKLDTIESALDNLESFIHKSKELRMPEHGSTVDFPSSDKSLSFEEGILRYNLNQIRLVNPLFINIYDLLKTSYLSIAYDFSDKNKISPDPLASIIMPDRGIYDIVSFFEDNGLLEHNPNEFLFTRKYDSLYSVLLDTTGSSASKDLLLSGSNLRPNKDYYLLDGSLCVSSDFLSQFINDMLNFNDVLKESMTTHYERDF